MTDGEAKKPRRPWLHPRRLASIRREAAWIQRRCGFLHTRIKDNAYESAGDRLRKLDAASALAKNAEQCIVEVERILARIALEEGWNHETPDP